MQIVFQQTTASAPAVPPTRGRRLWRPIALGLLVLAALLGLARVAPPIGGPTQIYNEVRIQRPRAEVFTFATTPANWPQWHPSSIAVSGATDHPLVIGEEVREVFRVAGRDGEATWRVTERLPDERWRIEGRVAGHAGRGLITYTFSDIRGDTRFQREFEYRMPTLWAEILDRLFIRDRIAGESTIAVTRLKQVLESR